MKDTTLGLVVLAHAKKRMAAADAVLRNRAADGLEPADRVSARVDGTVVGTVGKSDPKPKARVHDDEALRTWMQEHYPDQVETVRFIEDMPAGLDVLEKYAPHLVRTRQQVCESCVSSLLRTAEEVEAPVGPGGEADMPGITVTRPEGTVTVLPKKNTGHLIDALFAEGRVSLDGTVRPQIEGGK